MEWCADESYARFRDAATGLYRFEGTNPVTLLEQSGLIRIEAMLGGSGGLPQTHVTTPDEFGFSAAVAFNNCRRVDVGVGLLLLSTISAQG